MCVVDAILDEVSWEELFWLSNVAVGRVGR